MCVMSCACVRAMFGMSMWFVKGCGLLLRVVVVVVSVGRIVVCVIVCCVCCCVLCMVVGAVVVVFLCMRVVVCVCLCDCVCDCVCGCACVCLCVFCVCVLVCCCVCWCGWYSSVVRVFPVLRVVLFGGVCVVGVDWLLMCCVFEC